MLNRCPVDTLANLIIVYALISMGSGYDVTITLGAVGGLRGASTGSCGPWSQPVTNLGHCGLLCSVSSTCTGVNYDASSGTCGCIATGNFSFLSSTTTSKMLMKDVVDYSSGILKYCATPLAKMLPDSSITASSSFINNPAPQSKMSTTNCDAAWVASGNSNPGDYLQYSFDAPRSITMLAIRGRCSIAQYVTSYYIASSSDNGNTYTNYSKLGVTTIFQGGITGTVTAQTILPTPLININSLRLYPVTFVGAKAMAVEVYGC